MAQTQFFRSLTWFVTFRDPREIWFAHPTYLACEILFYITAILTLVHAYRLGGRYPYLWLATFFHGLTVESLSYFMPDIDNFWHAQSMVMFLGQRLPLHIVVLYPVFLYTSVVSVSRLRLPNWAEPFAVGLTVVLIDFPFDIIGVKHLWWTWHDTDPNILERNYWVPWVSYYFHASFAAALVIILKLARKFIIGSTVETSKLKELSCSLLTGILGMPVGVLFFVAFYHPLRDIFSINTEIIVIIYLALYLLIVWTADRNPVIDARTKGKRMFFLDEITLVVVIHYATILILTYLGKPERVIREGLHETVGPCDEIQELQTPLGMILTKRKYLCVTDYDEGYYDFNCVRNQRLQTGQNWYTTCGTPYHNFHEYLLIVGLSSMYSMYYFYTVLYRSGTDPTRSPFKVKRF